MIGRKNNPAKIQSLLNGTRFDSIISAYPAEIGRSDSGAPQTCVN
jgi:hypothetical protein